MTADPEPAHLDPRSVYAARATERRQQVVDLETIDRRFSWMRLATALVWLVTAWAIFDPQRLDVRWLAVPSLVFAALVLLHDRAARRLDGARRGVDFYASGLRRLDGELTYVDDGSAYADPDHPYAADLDLFGEVSLFRLLCGARTSAGRRLFARWLLGPAPAEVVLGRQAAARELGAAVNLRERLAVRGDQIGPDADPAALLAWSGRPSAWQRVPPAWVPLVFNGAVVVSAALAVWGPTARWFLVAVLGQSVFALWHRNALRAVRTGLDEAIRELRLLAVLLAELESATFRSPRLIELGRVVASAGMPPSAAIDHLQRLGAQLDSMRNPYFAPLGALLLWGTRHTVAIERWRLRHGAAVPGWVDAVAEFEALACLAAYHFENPRDPFADLTAGAARFEAVELGHPLLPIETCVTNSVALGDADRLLIVSGSNMSGKSTLMRSIGTAAVMAQMGAPVRAAALRMSPLAIGASIRISDSLREGMSGFYAEIRRFRQIVDLGEAGDAVLFLLEEILQTTNSNDRRAGARAVLASLLARDAIGLVTTHDLAITALAEELPQTRNVHFVDHIEGDQMRFDYRLRDGVVARSNAVALMRSIGLDV